MHVINFGQAQLINSCYCIPIKTIKIKIDEKTSRHKNSKYYNIVEFNKYNYDIISKENSFDKIFKHSPLNYYNGKCELKYSFITSEGIKYDKHNKIVEVCDRKRLVHLSNSDSPVCYELLRISDDTFEFAWNTKLMNIDEAKDLTIAFLENI